MILTAPAYNGLQKIASKTGMDCWFRLTQDAKGNDVCFDADNHKIVPLENVMSDFKDGITDPLESYGLSSDEKDALERLLKLF